MQSIVSYPDRGQGGNSKWRGNFAPQLIEDLIGQFHPRAVADPMMGSGTTPDVCRRLNVKCWATDLHQGFDIQKGELPLGFDMFIYHPPYWDIIPYSGNMWGRQIRATARLSLTMKSSSIGQMKICTVCMRRFRRVA